MQRTLHVCWLVDEWKPTRERYLRAWLKAGWPVVLWHGGQPPFDSPLAAPPVEGVELRHADEIILGSPSESAFLYEKRHKNHAACADLFRYEVLHKLGGAYSDIDVLPGKGASPKLFETLQHPLFGRCWLPLQWQLEIRFVITPRPQHPLLERLRDAAVANSAIFMANGGHATDHELSHVIGRTGPGMAKVVVREYAKEVGLRPVSFLLKNATNDSTSDNAEHFTLKQEIVRSIATTP